MKHKLTKITLSLLILIAFAACQNTESVNLEIHSAEKPNIENLNKQMNAWHIAATNRDADTYFGMMAADAVFIGTDKTENWTKQVFEGKYRPYFAEGKSWDFKPIERNWYFNKAGNTAWFDETLDTWMGVCQSSGVMEKENNGDWLIRHYQLSLTIDNDKMDTVIAVTRSFSQM